MDKEITDKLQAKAAALFGGAGQRLFFAPGRVNLIGEHIDYNGGHVLPCALTLGTYGAAKRRQDRRLRSYSMNMPEAGVIETDLDSLESRPVHGWAAYPAGAVWAFMQHGFVPETGFDLAVYGTVPDKSGLSSSASLEVLTGTVLCHLFGFDCGPAAAARLGQEAENRYVGVQCGIMDQFASAMGKKDQAILLDCASLAYRYVPVRLGDAQLVIVNSNKPHELSDSAYNDRRRECERALADLKKHCSIDALCQLTPEEFQKAADVIEDPICRRRAEHAVFEEARTLAAAAALESGDIRKFGQLMAESHISLRDQYEVSCRELDILVEEALSIRSTVGARMTGGGFGGCTVNIVQKDAVPYFTETVGRHYHERTGLRAAFYIAGIGEGAREIV